MSAHYDNFFDELPNGGYEPLLHDCMSGDAALFQRADNIEASWAVVDPIMHAWKSVAPERVPCGKHG
jgi:glucose-6-phosphate 1-dehydrogenase